jgi:hypothetical protein
MVDCMYSAFGITMAFWIGVGIYAYCTIVRSFSISGITNTLGAFKYIYPAHLAFNIAWNVLASSGFGEAYKEATLCHKVRLMDEIYIYISGFFILLFLFLLIR